MRLWLVRLLWNNCEYFSELGFLRNNSLDISCIYLFQNLLKNIRVLRFYSLHEIRASCRNSFYTLFCNSSLSYSRRDDFGNRLFKTTDYFLFLICNDSNLLIFICHFRDCSISNFLHNNPDWGYIFYFSIFSLYLFDNLLKMSIFFYYTLINYLSYNNLLYDLLNAYCFNFFFHVNSFRCNNLDICLVNFIQNCNNYFFLFWSGWLLNN